MKGLVATLALFISSGGFATIHNQNLKAPPPVVVGRNNEQAIFVDFKTAHYTITYDTKNQTALAQSEIVFENELEGFPIFDLEDTPASLEIDNEAATSNTHTVTGVTTFRYVNLLLKPGRHTLKITHRLSENVIFTTGSVKSAFWTSDLADRNFLEQYLPTNLEFDQYKIIMDVAVTQTQNVHEIFHNGSEQEIGFNQWRLEFPEHFNSSSTFFHLTQKNLFRRVNFNYQSVDGRQIPVTIYSVNDVTLFKDETQKTLEELEKDYGPFPHNKLVIYGAGSGGMEYCGATITSLWALSHELTHSYFARGVMPASGNAGWFDEAVASWRDANYRQSELVNLTPASMAGHSVYSRKTDRDAYTKGERFLGYLDKMFKDKGGFKAFLRKMTEMRLFKPFQNHELKLDIEQFFNHSLDHEFNRYVLGKSSEMIGHQKSHSPPNPYHPVLTKKELMDLL